MMVLTCTAPAASVQGQGAYACPAGSAIWQEFTANGWEALTYTDVSILLGGTITVFAAAWGFRKILKFFE